jgi:hypothetical protein
VSPVLPELPVVAVGLAAPVELAPPVSPVFVTEDWAVALPELPEVALGAMTRSTLPPAPPLASPLAMESPPVTVPLPRALPAPTLTTEAEPALPPDPPTARPLMVLVTSPVFPEWATADDEAPEFASLTALPVEVALPVSPLLPLDPPFWAATRSAAEAGFAGAVPRSAGRGGAVDVVLAAVAASWLEAGGASNKRAAATPVAPARHAAPERRPTPLAMKFLPA